MKIAPPPALSRLIFYCGLATVLTGLCLAQGSQSSATSVGLVAWWPFDETSGITAHDASGHGNDGTLACSGNCTPLPAWSAGVRNGALNFSSPNDFVGVQDNAGLHLSNQFTIAFWLRKAAGATNVVYMGKGRSRGQPAFHSLPANRGIICT